MGAPYQSQSASNYNASPPPDDGSTTAANKITWATIKSKLPDPIKTLADAINTALRTALNVTPTTTSTAYTTQTLDHMTTIEVTGTTTISLGDAATMIAQSMGYTVTIYNKDTALTTTVALITNTNKLDGTVNGTTTILPGQAKTFTVAQSGVDYETISSSIKYQTTTWTPVLTFATAGDQNIAYTTQVGTYTKIGRRVTVDFFILTSTFTFTTASGALEITGLPFAAAANTVSYIGAVLWSGITKASYTNVVARIASGLSLIDFTISGSGQTVAVVSSGDVPTGGTVQLRGTISYDAVT